MTIGILGNGFVGNAIANGFSLFCDVRIYDKDPLRSINTLEDTVINSEYVFICVPTPMKVGDRGKVDTSIIEDVLQEVQKIKIGNRDRIYVIKSSVPPGSVEKFIEQYPDLNIVFNPEFLTERSANLDFINATRIVIGGDKEHTDKLEEVYRKRFPYKKIITTDVTTAQFIKYMANCFFSVKISYMNEMLQVSKELGVDWDVAKEGFLSDGRVGNSHHSVPGYDGELGFGGKCFPKDINAFINIAKELDVNPLVLQAAWEKNLEVRKTRDWEEIPGATS